MEKILRFDSKQNYLIFFWKSLHPGVVLLRIHRSWKNAWRIWEEKAHTLQSKKRMRASKWDYKKGLIPVWCYLCLWVLAQPCLSNYSIPIDLSLLLLNPFFFSAGSFILCKNFWTENVSLELQTPQPIWIMFWLSVWKINLDQSSMILTI